MELSGDLRISLPLVCNCLVWWAVCIVCYVCVLVGSLCCRRRVVVNYMQNTRGNRQGNLLEKRYFEI
jgi:hypothetical protein